jgi:uncharacterized protein YbaP (TraB family)
MRLRVGSSRHRAIIGAGLAVLCCCAAPLAQTEEGARVCSDPLGTMLWEVRGEGLSERGITLHLFGSMHVGKPEFYPLPAPVEASLRGAEHVVFEVDPRSAAEPQAVAEMQRAGRLPPGRHLHQLLSPGTLVLLQTVLQQQGLAVAQMRRLKPWMIALLLGDLQSRALGFEAAYGLETYLMAQRDPHSEVLQLESLRQQVAMLEQLDPEVFLGYSLHEFKESAAEIEALAQAWQCGDHAALEALLFSNERAPNLSEMQRADLRELHQKLFTERNLVMADGIEKLIATGQDDYFVAVGAGHLVGTDSIVELLRRRGYRVEPVRL